MGRTPRVQLAFPDRKVLNMRARAGDWVEVLSKQEILRTLDKNGRLDGLPFMPQMFKYCGQRFRIYKTAYKTCDTVSGDYSGRRLQDGYHLSLRCDGDAYDGCQAGCLIFWKAAWLKPVEGPVQVQYMPRRLHSSREVASPNRCTERDVLGATKHQDIGGDVRYSCQATELLNYTQPLGWWDARQYVEAYRAGNQTLQQLARGFWYLAYYYGTLAFSDRWGRPARWLYNRFQAITGGIPFPRMKGTIPVGQSTPRCDLGLQPGDLVRVKSYEDILATLDGRLSNRGMSFDAELVPFCGKIFRVSTRVERFVDEKTGQMRRMNTPAVILEGTSCKALYSGRRMFCTRSIHSWWREIWLERVSIDACPRTALSSHQAAARAAAEHVHSA
ncbi:hypothetical protein [Bradyrhizobium sp. STM 3843]|uniref:hypothetical protein n=1 Tax=Bradyrhizobium sp. STM 3843 TaxID=551947 RepID=UPI0002F4B901|nr:hypothetical protein [Bradyrhizobium sp. STM 3843]